MMRRDCSNFCADGREAIRDTRSATRTRVEMVAPTQRNEFRPMTTGHLAISHLESKRGAMELRSRERFVTLGEVLHAGRQRAARRALGRPWAQRWITAGWNRTALAASCSRHNMAAPGPAALQAAWRRRLPWWPRAEQARRSAATCWRAAQAHLRIGFRGRHQAAGARRHRPLSGQPPRVPIGLNVLLTPMRPDLLALAEGGWIIGFAACPPRAGPALAPWCAPVSSPMLPRGLSEVAAGSSPDLQEKPLAIPAPGVTDRPSGYESVQCPCYLTPDGGLRFRDIPERQRLRRRHRHCGGPAPPDLVPSSTHH